MSSISSSSCDTRAFNLQMANFGDRCIDSTTTRLKNFKENILQEISTKWDSTSKQLNNNNNDNNGQTLGFLNRKTKNRSVWGQPKMDSNSMQHSSHWKSLDSLEYCESQFSFGSNSTSFSDLRTLDCQKTQDMLVSDLGTSVESFDNEQEPLKRCPSVNSTSSGCSVTDSQEEMAREAKDFMKQFVEKIFANSSSITLEEKAKFGYHARTEAARLWFARCINKKRNENKCVKESTFYSLAQYFAIVLFECAESDDFTPAKVLMNMCFTYYHYQSSSIHNGHGPWSQQQSFDGSESSSCSSSSVNQNKQYLYTVLRDQPIWKLHRFWNAAFFDAIQCERDNFYENHHHLHKQDEEEIITEKKFYDWQFHANLTFGQLGTFTYNMYSFGLSKKFCLEFLYKQSTIANLTSEQLKILHDNIEAMYHRREMIMLEQQQQPKRKHLIKIVFKQ